jgi:hypothetical protein
LQQRILLELKIGFTCLMLFKSSHSPYMKSQVSTVQEVHCQVDLLAVLESVCHVNEETIQNNYFLGTFTDDQATVKAPFHSLRSERFALL